MINNNSCSIVMHSYAIKIWDAFCSHSILLVRPLCQDLFVVLTVAAITKPNHQLGLNLERSVKVVSKREINSN